MDTTLGAGESAAGEPEYQCYSYSILDCWGWEMSFEKWKKKVERLLIKQFGTKFFPKIDWESLYNHGLSPSEAVYACDGEE